MKKHVLSILMLIFYALPLSAQELSPTMQNIFKQTMGVNGHLTKAMHDEFWKEMERTWSKNEIKLFSQIMKPNLLAAQSYQRELWESAKISYQSKRIVKTQRLIDLENETALQFKKSLPYPRGSRDYKSAVNGYNKARMKSAKNARLLLEAAAAHKSMLLANNRAQNIDQTVISTVLRNLNASIKRLNVLFTEKWSIASDSLSQFK